MLNMHHIFKRYRTDFVETCALHDISLDVEPGDFVSIMGPSGSGKSTFLNVAGLLDAFDEGSYSLDGEDVSHLNDRQRSRIRNAKIGFIFQSFNLIADLNVFDNVDVPLRYQGLNRKERRQRIDASLEAVGLQGRAKHLPAQLSGGQQQRVAIARALAGNPALILADEPTGNLDTHMAREVMDLLESINEQGTTLIMVTHQPDLARRAPRQIHFLDGRKMDVLEGEAPALIDERQPTACTCTSGGSR